MFNVLAEASAKLRRHPIISKTQEVNIYLTVMTSLPGHLHALAMTFQTYLWDLVHHFGHDCQAAYEGARGHKRSRQLDAKLARHVAERLQLVRVAADAFHVGVAEFILHVDKPEHPLQEVGPEVRQHGFQIDGSTARRVVPSQGLEEILEKLGVLNVHHPICSHKHVVQRDLSVIQKLPEKLCKGRWNEN